MLDVVVGVLLTLLVQGRFIERVSSAAKPAPQPQEGSAHGTVGETTQERPAHVLNPPTRNELRIRAGFWRANIQDAVGALMSALGVATEPETSQSDPTSDSPLTLLLEIRKAAEELLKRTQEILSTYMTPSEPARQLPTSEKAPKRFSL